MIGDGLRVDTQALTAALGRLPEDRWSPPDATQWGMVHGWFQQETARALERLVLVERGRGGGLPLLVSLAMVWGEDSPLQVPGLGELWSGRARSLEAVHVRVRRVAIGVWELTDVPDAFAARMRMSLGVVTSVPTHAFAVWV